MKLIKDARKPLDVEREQKVAEKRFERLKSKFEDGEVGYEGGGNSSTKGLRINNLSNFVLYFFMV